MYASRMISSTNQPNALTIAQGQPSALNRPKKARRLAAGMTSGAGGTVCAIAQPPIFSVPVMFGCTEHTNE